MDNTGLESKTSKSEKIWEALLDVKPGSSGSLSSHSKFIMEDSLHLRRWLTRALVSTARKLLCLLCPQERWERCPELDFPILQRRREGIESWWMSSRCCYRLLERLSAIPPIHQSRRPVDWTYWAPYMTLVSIYQANIAVQTKKVFLFAWFYISCQRRDLQDYDAVKGRKILPNIGTSSWCQTHFFCTDRRNFGILKLNRTTWKGL